MNTEMLATDLVANVIRHARGHARLRLLRSQTLVCEVFDGSVTTPRIRRASWTDECGRGLQLPPNPARVRNHVASCCA